MSLLPRALQFRDESLSLPLPEKERAYDWSPCPVKAELRKFERALGMVAVPGKPGHMTQVTEADCRQHKSNGTAQQPVPQVLPPSSPEAQGAVAVPPMFAVGQKWKRRDGKIIFIKRVDETSVPVQGDDTYWRYPNGKSLDAMLAWDLVELIADVSPSKPTEDSEGWIEWKGGECPIPDAEPGAYMVRFRDGRESEQHLSRPANSYRWLHREALADIVAYRLVKQ